MESTEDIKVQYKFVIIIRKTTAYRHTLMLPAAMINYQVYPFLCCLFAVSAFWSLWCKLFFLQFSMFALTETMHYNLIFYVVRELLLSLLYL
jgi:hypothetical protein